MENTTILFGSTNGLSNKANRYLFGIAGLIFVIVTIAKVIESRLVDAYYITYIMIGIWFCIKSLMTFPFNPLSPKIIINNLSIIFKKSVFKPDVKLDWNDIKSIQFDEFKIHFGLESGVDTFEYKSNDDISLRIKKSLRKMAASKNVEITDE